MTTIIPAMAGMVTMLVVLVIIINIIRRGLSIMVVHHTMPSIIRILSKWHTIRQITTRVQHLPSLLVLQDKLSHIHNQRWCHTHSRNSSSSNIPRMQTMPGVCMYHHRLLLRTKSYHHHISNNSNYYHLTMIHYTPTPK